MKTKIFTVLLVLLAIAQTGCKKFLEVDPKSTISEDQLFSSEVGFQQALIGVYSQAASRAMYGDNLSMGFASMIAQNYSATTNLFPFPQTVALNFRSGDAIAFVSSIWLNSYNAISGVNNILNSIDAKKSIFTNNNYNLVKGEALGLRAYIHFDLLRLYGPTYASGSEKKSIPYRTELNALSKVPSTVNEVVNALLADLKLAETLLKGTDPFMGGDKNRRFRMNYLAVKALEARIYLFKGDNPNAIAAATEVINAPNLSFITVKDISAAAPTKDRLFSTEQVFALRVRNIKDWAETNSGYFRSGSDNRYYLTRSEANFNTLFETGTGGTTDYRSAYLIQTDGTVKFCSKFWQTWVLSNTDVETNRLDQTVPLIRMSEMYYILAETAGSAETGIGYINKVRENRGLTAINTTGITQQKLTAEITKEYQKEFYAEGQLFFYYKRKAVVRMLFGNKDLNEASYIVPVPDNELEFNPNYN